MVDYASAVVPAEHRQGLLSRLAPLSFENLDTGMHGYAKRHRSHGCQVYYDARGPHAEQMGCLMQLSGEGLRLLEAHGADLAELFAWIIGVGGHFTRFDWAHDLKGSDMTARDVLRMAKRNLCTRAHRWRPHEEYHHGSRIVTGISIGSRQSDSYARFYCKQTQMREVFKQSCPPWLRFEWQFGGARADALVRMFIAGDIEGIIAECRAFADFRELDNERKTRRSAMSWWLQVVQVGKVARITLETLKERSLARTKAWLKHQVSSAFALVCESDGGSIDFLMEMLDVGRRRMSGRHRMLLEVARC